MKLEEVSIETTSKKNFVSLSLSTNQKKQRIQMRLK